MSSANMWSRTVLSERLRLKYPILQAPMAGGPATPELVSAVSNAGGLGCLGLGYSSPKAIAEAIAAVRRLSDWPFAVNLFAPESRTVTLEQIERGRSGLRPILDDLGLPPSFGAVVAVESFDEQLAVVLEARVPVLSFTFGTLSGAHMAALKGKGAFIIGTATTVKEGRVLEASGVDAVVGQGAEAGGHRGTFASGSDQGMIGSLALVPALADALSCPVIAAGGIMDARGVIAALALGAAGVQMGTAFLATRESGAPEAHKQALRDAGDVDATAITTVISGRSARGIKNRFMDAVDPETVLPYPSQHFLTRELRAIAAKQNRPEYMAMWAGQGRVVAGDVSAAALIEQIAKDAPALVSQLYGA